MDSSESRSLWGSRWARRLALGLAAVGGAVLLVTTGVRVFCDAEYVEGRLNRALDSTSVSAYRVDVGDVRWGLWLGSLRMERVVVRRESSAGESAPSGEAKSHNALASVPSIAVEGIRLWPLLWRHLVVSTVRVERPRLRLPTRERIEASLGPSDSRDSTVTVPSSSASSPWTGGPQVSLERIEVQGGTVSVARDSAAAVPADSLWGVSVTVAQEAPTSVEGLDLKELLAGRARLTFDGYRRVFADSLYVFRLGPGRLAPSDSMLRVGALRFVPTVPDSVFMHRHEVRTNRYFVKVKRIGARGVDYRRFFKSGALIAETVRVEAGTLDVYRDNHRPPAPEDPPPPMPGEIVQSLDRPLRIDTIRVINSDIRYAKRKERVPTPGSISFEDLWATLYNVTNNPRRMTRSSPAVLDARAKVAGVGLLHTTIRVPLLTSGVSLSYDGQLGAMDARAFNETFVHLAGVRVEQGQVDSLWFEAEVSDGLATGWVRGVYRNLEVETMNPVTGGRGLKNRLKTLIVNGLGLRSDVVPGEGPLRTGTIRYEYEEEMTFFKFLWQSLRSGIYSLVGLDRLPR